MKGTLKRLLIFVLCLTLVVGESTVGAFAAGIDTTQVEVNSEQDSEEVSEEATEETDEAIIEKDGSTEEATEETGETDEEAVTDRDSDSEETIEETIEETAEDTTGETVVEEENIVEEGIVDEEASDAEGVLTATFTFDNTNGNLGHLKGLYSRDFEFMSQDVYSANPKSRVKINPVGGITNGSSFVLKGNKAIVLAFDTEIDNGYKIEILNSRGGQLTSLPYYDTDNTDCWHFADSVADATARYYSLGGSGNESYTVRVVPIDGYYILLSGTKEFATTFVGNFYSDTVVDDHSVEFKTENEKDISKAVITNSLTNKEYKDVTADIVRTEKDGETYYTYYFSLDTLRQIADYEVVELKICELQDIDAPANVKGTLVGGEIKATWGAVAGATGYQVRIYNGDNNVDTNWISVGKALSYTTKNLVLKPDIYTIAVRAENADGASYSNGEYEFTLTKEMASRVALAQLILDEKPTVYTEINKQIVVDTILAPSAAYCYKDEMKYTSSNPEVATVNAEGTISTLKSGWTMITVSLRNKSASYWLCVNGNVESVNFVNPDSDTVLKGKSTWYSTVIEPAYVNYNFELEWISSDESVVRITQGGSAGVMVEAVGAGEAKVILKINGESFAEKEITVKDTLDIVWVDSSVKKSGKVSYCESLVNALADFDFSARNIAGKVFLGWYTEPDGKGKCISKYDDILEPLTLYGYWQERTDSFTVSPIGDMEYNGYQLYPSVVVYDGAITLSKDRDYKVSYSKNINVGTGTVVVQGLGNYTSKVTKTFNIVPTDISERGYAEDIFVLYNKRVQKPAVKVTDTWNNKTLRNKIDYDITYPSAGDYTAPGRYEIRIVGKGNYKGTTSAILNIGTGKLVSKLRIVVEKDNGKDWKCQGSEVQIAPKVHVYDGKKELTENFDYSVSYQTNNEIGYGAIFVYGNDVSYWGRTMVKFKIVGEPINRAVVEGVENQEYSDVKVHSASGITLPNLKVYSDRTKATLLTDGIDYDVYYSNNYQAGACRVQIVGKGKYSGSIIKTFKITPKVANQSNVTLNNGEELKVMYHKGGYVNPVNVVRVDGYALSNNDYSVRVTNTSQPATPDDVKAPTITIIFKNNYRGTYTTKYEISKLDPKEGVSYECNDVEVAKTPNRWKSNAVLFDVTTGKRLTLNSDYKLSYQCRTDWRESYRDIDSKEILPVGTEVRVVVDYNDKYFLKEEGKINAFSYYIVGRSIQKATVRIDDQYFDANWRNSEKPYIDYSEITVKYGTTTLTSEDFFVVLPTNFMGEVGTWYAVIVGKGNYGGTKVVRFKIKPKTIK